MLPFLPDWQGVTMFLRVSFMYACMCGDVYMYVKISLIPRLIQTARWISIDYCFIRSKNRKD